MRERAIGVRLDLQVAGNQAHCLTCSLVERSREKNPGFKQADPCGGGEERATSRDTSSMKRADAGL